MLIRVNRATSAHADYLIPSNFHNELVSYSSNINSQYFDQGVSMIMNNFFDSI